MARARMLCKTIATDKRLNKLSPYADWMYIRAIPHLDRDGIIDGDPDTLAVTICPWRLALIADEMPNIINEWVKSGLVIRYKSGDRTALYFVGFQKNQSLEYKKEAASTFSVPPGMKRTDRGLVDAERSDKSTSGGDADDYSNEGRSALDDYSKTTRTEYKLNKDQSNQKESVVDTTRARVSEPPPPSLQETLNAAVNELERQQTLKLMASWEKGSEKSKNARVRVSPTQEAIIYSQSPATEVPTVKSADPLPPTVNPNRVISMPDGQKLIIDELIWAQMMSVMLAGLGMKELADAGVARVRNDAARTLETLCKMNARFRNKEGIQELFASWSNTRPDYPVPKPEWLEEHASLYLSGGIRYQNERKGTHNGRSGTSSKDSKSAADLYPEYAKFT